MMMVSFAVAVMMTLTSVSAAFGLEGRLQLHKIGAEAAEHILDHVVGTNTKNVVLNFSGQMSISQMPGKAHKLMGIFVLYFDDIFGCGLNSQPPAVFKLQTISIGHGNRLRKVEKNLFSMIRSQANASPMTCVEIQRESTRRFFSWPVVCRAMNGSTMNRIHSHTQYMK